MGSARRLVRLPGPLAMRCGGVLPQVDIAYETWGALSPAKDNVLLLVTGLSPSAHARSSAEDPTPGWWEEMIGPGQPLDTDRFHVVCVNSLGSPHGSTSPAAIDPRTGEPYRVTFPVLTIEDIATAAREALRALGLPRVRVVVGPSLGGMTALAYAIQFPGEVDALVSVSAAARATPFAIAVRSVQREAIRSDPEWRGGSYEPPGPVNGLRVARKLGLITYRSAAEWRQRFSRERVDVRAPGAGPFDVEFEIEAYLEMHAQKFVGTFDANCYLYLSRAMDLFDVAEHGGSVEAGLGRIQAHRTLVVGVETDFLFPIDQQEEIARLLERAGRDVRFVRLPSIQGHDSFLVDHDRFGPTLGPFLQDVAG
ncbi:MAG TPA: homoserine O-acetyltransferase [Vicinamibacteria bacterium]|nr:homoserine O-acetyltransferase [Vicinamibacteria bacterium]